LESEPDLAVVGETGDGAEALAAARHLTPDVVLMDIRMPSMDGLEATRRLTAELPATRVLIVTTFGRNEYVFEALRAGASGFLLKDAPPEELIAAVRIIAAGDALLAPAITNAVITEFVRRSPRAQPSPALDALTGRELEVLQLVAHGLANSEIAATLFISEATIRTHIGHVLTKLGLRDRVQAVIYTYETGMPQPGQAG
jgi:DNA-binding NarL/FixJ family response regulator